MKCASCGAPLEVEMEQCPYCGSSTPYGEFLQKAKLQGRQDAEKKEMAQARLSSRPRMKYVSGAFVPLLYFFTIGWYAPIWYALRLRPLNELNPPAKMPAWAVGLYNLLWMCVIILPNWEEELGLMEEQGEQLFNAALGTAIALSVWLAFRARSILQGYAAKFLEGSVAVHAVAPSNILLVLFGPMYLQCQVNTMIRMELLASQI